jgi:hypothetical protein
MAATRESAILAEKLTATTASEQHARRDAAQGQRQPGRSGRLPGISAPPAPVLEWFASYMA